MHIDMNLLTALDALLDEASVSRAAVRLHLSQPAMSRTLARLREATGDPILVRVGRTMVPSPRAQALRSEVRTLVRQARSVLSPERALDPARLERTFTIRCHDALLPMLAVALLSRLRHEAPNVMVRFVGESAGDAEDTRSGRIDLDVGSTKSRGAATHGEEVGQDELAVALRPDHPCARQKLTARRYADALHGVISRRGRMRDPIDQALETLGLRRQVMVSVPTTEAALHVAKACGLLVTVALRACGSMAQSRRLVLRRLPVPVDPLPIVQSWHPQLEDDPAHQWLRGITKTILGKAMTT
jgi:DNA-binding transcriptional LysR family regulator